MATKKQLSLSALQAIDVQIRKLRKADDVNPVDVLYELLETVEGTAHEIALQAESFIGEQNRKIKDAELARAEAEGREVEEERGTFFASDTPDAADRSQIVLENPSHVTALIRTRIHNLARTIMRKQPKLSLAEASNLVVLNLLLNAEARENGVEELTNAPVVPFVVIGMKNYHQLATGQLVEKTFGLPNNTTMSGREILRRGFADTRYFGLYGDNHEPLEVLQTNPGKANIPTDADALTRSRALEETVAPMPGKLQAGRNARSANAKQRIIAQAMTLVCPWPGCSTPAVECDVHHLFPWDEGGCTDCDNLTCACKTHNGRNDDRAGQALNGKLVMKDWEIFYQPADGGPLVPNRHPMGKYTSTANLKEEEPLDLAKMM